MDTEYQTGTIPETGSQENTVPQIPKPEPFTPLGSASQSTQESSASAPEVEYRDAGWSWGGFAFNFMFAIAIRRYAYLFLMLLMFVPLVNFVVVLGVMIYFGMNGRELARSSATFSNKEQYLGFMKGLDHAGKIIMYFYIIIVVVGIGASIVLVSLAGARDRAQDAYMKSEQQSLEFERMMEESEGKYYR